MKSFQLLTLLITLSVFGCRERTKIPTDKVEANNKTFILDTAIRDTVQRHITFHSQKHFSSFETPAEIRFVSNGAVVDSIIETGFHMISWYSSRKDTIDLVAHVGEFETQALLIRFIDKIPQVYFYRASHEGQKYFRLTKTDSLAGELEVPSTSYKLALSDIPDSKHKPIVFGSIDMESGTYFDERGPIEKERIQMKFYFCSQFRDFGYPQ